jgi:hypothetical protein
VIPPEISFTRFPDLSATHAQRARASFERLAEIVAQPKSYAKKSAMPLIKLARFGDRLSEKNSLRHDANVLAVTGIEGDHDAGTMTLDDAAEKLSFAGVAAILYTSPSHREDAPRFRVLAPLSHEYAPHDRRRFVARLNGVLRGLLAPESFVLSQSYYIGRADGAPYAHKTTSGSCIDLLDELDPVAIDPSKDGDGNSRAERVHCVQSSDSVIARLRERGLVKRGRSDGGVDIRCPFDGEHTTPAGATDTTYFPAHTGGFKNGHFKCMHSHCLNRSDAEFLEAIGLPPINPELQAGEGVRPPTAHPPSEEDERPWPAQLAPEAYHGLAGEIVRAIEPHTEADPAAILFQVLVAFGAMIERKAHVRVEGDRHYANLFLALVGETSKARKGTSWGRVSTVFQQVSGWCSVVSGLSSGEGLKWQVRDKTEDAAGVFDKRLLVLEPEFAQVLRVVARQGNTLSACVRNAWDNGNLATLTKNDPIRATGAHISIVGHITAHELRAELTRTDAANGFANRFLFVCAKRSKCLPFGGALLTEERLAGFADRIASAVESANSFAQVDMTEAAKAIWASVYPQLSEGAPGLFGAVTARAEAQTLRLAMLYALLDGASVIDGVHLLAALAAWEYCAASAQYVFGSALGDPVADEILRALRNAGDEGLARTEISALFGRNQTSERIGVALQMLARRKLVRSDQRPTQGRSIEVWFACRPTKETN